MHGCMRRRPFAPKQFSQEGGTAQCAAWLGLHDLTVAILGSVHNTPERSCHSPVCIYRRKRSVDDSVRTDFHDRSSNLDNFWSIFWSSNCKQFVVDNYLGRESGSSPLQSLPHCAS